MTGKTGSQKERAPLFGLVLAGGYGRRMGADKGRLTIEGRQFFERAYDEVSAVCERAFVSVRADQATPGSPYLPFPLVVDAAADCGPLAGIAAAAEKHPGAAWLVVACDMPNANRSAISRLVSYRDSRYDAVVYSRDKGLEPLFGIWEAPATAGARKALTAGRLAVRDVLTACRVLVVSPTDPNTALNLNTRDDLADYVSARRHFAGGLT